MHAKETHPEPKPGFAPAEPLSRRFLEQLPDACQECPESAWFAPLLRRLLEHLPAAAYTCDAEGLITFYNERAVELWGRAPRLNDPVDRFCGSFRLFSPAGVPIRHEDCWMALALRYGREYRGHEIVVERPDGSRRNALAHTNPIYDERGQLQGAVNILVDITESRRAEEANRRLTDRFRLLWEAAELLLHADDPDAMLRDLFARIAPHLGLDLYLNYMTDEATGSLRLLSHSGVPEEAMPRVACLEFGQAISGTVALRREPMVVSRVQECADPIVQKVRALGVRAYVCAPLLAGDRLLGTLSFGSRVREAFDAEDVEFLATLARYVTVAWERLRLVRELREADRRKDRFLATLSHELRNPLAPIRNALELIRQSDFDPAVIERARAVLERQLQQMVRLIDDLLDLSRIATGRIRLTKERVALASVLNAAVETARPLIEGARHRLTVTVPAEPVHLEADSVRLAQVFANLLNNAAKYTDPGGAIEIVARRSEREVEVAVRDTGIGIAPEDVPRIFEIFSQARPALERSQGGLGVGLSLVRGLVELHGGSVRVRSEGVGRGSEFVVRLPLASAATSGIAERERPSEPARARKRRVLVVDDNRDAAETLAELLAMAGHETRAAFSGAEAVEVAASFRPDIVIMDLGMPGLDGYEAARRLRKEPWGSAVRLIALTGWGQQEDREQTAAAGFDAHLTKPVDPAALTRLLEAP